MALPIPYNTVKMLDLVAKPQLKPQMIRHAASVGRPHHHNHEIVNNNTNWKDLNIKLPLKIVDGKLMEGIRYPKQQFHNFTAKLCDPCIQFKWQEREYTDGNRDGKDNTNNAKVEIQ